jgi:hypothetical protein
MVETILLGLLLLVPLIWVLGVLSEVHRVALATTSAAREAGFDAARAATPIETERRIDVAVAAALADHGVDPAGARVEWATDLVRGGQVELRVSYDVPVLQAPLLGSVGGPSISVSASHVARVDPYRSRP